MTDFTLGPWVNDNGLVFGREEDGTPSFDIFDADSWAGDAVEAHANARLIAVAPKMYAALKEVMECLFAHDPDATKALLMADDALAEVDGK